MATFIDRLNYAVAMREGELGMRILKKDLAQAAGVSSSAVTQWLQGTTGELKAASVFGLANYLKVRPEWLWNKEGPVRTSAKSSHAAAPAEPPESKTPKLTHEANRFVKLIETADADGLISEGTLHAFAALFERFVNPKMEVVDLTAQRGIERAEQLVASHQPKHRKGKGAA